MFLDRDLSQGGRNFRDPAAAGVDGATGQRWIGLMHDQGAQQNRAFFTFLAIATDFVTILASALIAGLIYHAAVYEMAGTVDNSLRVGAIIAALFIVPKVLRKDYAFAHYFSTRDQIARCITVWNIAFLGAVVLAFLTKTSATQSRGSFLLFYALGFVAISLTRAGLVKIARRQASEGKMNAKRIMLVGFEDEMDRFSETYDPRAHGMRVIAASYLRGTDTLKDDLALAAASARMLRPDDVYILVPWSNKEAIDACVTAFLRVPASLHLGPERVLERFRDAKIEHSGPIASINLVRRPLTMAEVIQKRAFDIVVSSLALLLLSPLFLLVALLIKLDSKGPAFFLQRRYGFNQEPFRIYKFRSMTTMDDGREIVQAKVGDARITRIGAYLRRFNIDELPQLINVLRGEMSLVGPRPHALAHDQHFERTIALYARRHNVKPGITGWAQVHGLRGEISSPEMMKARVDHDLYYIDNWSLWLDIWIIIATVISPKAYKNAV
jgi:Undecaprenyl-phosphate glucose phosphotransferase